MVIWINYRILFIIIIIIDLIYVVCTSIPFGIYDSESVFNTDADNMVTFVKRKLGDDILSVRVPALPERGPPDCDPSGSSYP